MQTRSLAVMADVAWTTRCPISRASVNHEWISHIRMNLVLYSPTRSMYRRISLGIPSDHASETQSIWSPESSESSLQSLRMESGKRGEQTRVGGGTESLPFSARSSSPLPEAHKARVSGQNRHCCAHAWADVTCSTCRHKFAIRALDRLLFRNISDIQ